MDLSALIQQIIDMVKGIIEAVLGTLGEGEGEGFDLSAILEKLLSFIETE